ncbi:diphosphate--fructose-6-phosphate 1-phosphotransferase [Petroclostridium sp. X23]|uniref:diphosphate--fructose-6-phosphate 1-phosphotransferase n=1 Tax=Petroclostridium sp. X23 TaxID=3045146 RepID=UPI0024AD0A16|nr:diphosphate--fructose-6-phosphate 1-phosphotransferase [Petroclostridium sp. X23]WHH56852.1 diphosphate--fructose-6-phosphate 1-phosphotransferase [Petroclostridium sp. X23]
MKGNLLIAHGGGPTTVINASLYGAIEEAKKCEEVDAIYGSLGGVDGILREDFIDFKKQPQQKLELLPYTPASAIGTSRTKLYEEDYEKIVQTLVKNNIKYLLFNGGNGSMDTCGKIYKFAAQHDIKVIGIPKTMDNDIAVTDHSPGFGSAARYIAVSVAEVAQDIKSMPIHVCIIEALGRNAGWVTAASAMARKKEGDAPHLIYLPERPFSEKEFLEDVKAVHEKLGGVVVVVSEGLKNAKGEPIVDPIFTRGRDVYFGDVSAHLATLVIKELGIKARNEKPGILGRASTTLQSNVDRQEAIQAGALAAKAAISGETGKMVGFKRISDQPYQCEAALIPIEEVMMHEKIIPDHFINTRGNDVTPAFIEYCKGLIGGPLPEYAEFR